MIFHNPTMLCNFFIMFFRKKVKEAMKSKVKEFVKTDSVSVG